MKKIILLLFGALVGIPAICQTDTVQLYTFPGKVTPKAESVVRLLHIKLRKAIRQEVAMGMDAVYAPETDVQGGNATKTKAAVIIYQLPLSVQVSQAQLDSISAYIKKITEALVIPKPDLVTDIDNLPGPGLTFSPSANLGINVFNATGWYHFQSNPTAVPPITWPDAAHNKSFSVLPVAGFIEIDIDGYKFEWYTERRINHGIATVSVDGAAPVDVDLYEATTVNNSQKVYTWNPAGSTNKVRKVRISFSGRKNPASTETNIIHDYLKVYKKQ